MIGKITSITNSCIDKSITFCNTSNKCDTGCNAYQVVGFKWRDRERRNTIYEYDSISGGFSTCMRDKVKIIDLNIQLIEQDRTTRGILRKMLDKVMTNYDCCDNCCPFRVEFEDDDGQSYYFEAKLGSEVVQDEFGGHNIIHQFDYKLEVCGNGIFVNADELSCCGGLGHISGFKIPYFCGSSCVVGSKHILYDGNVCGDFRVEIQANKLVNPIFYNLSKNAFYGLDGTFSGEITIDTKNGVTVNGNSILPSERKIGSSFKNVKLAPGVSEVMLSAESGEASWCMYYSNNMS